MESQAINEILSCPICTELPKDKVFQCVNGHWICFECKVQLSDCPQCRTPYGDQPVRSLLAEGLLDEMLLQCTNRECGQSIKKKDLAAHHKACSFRPVKLCLIFGYPNCQVVTNTGDEFRKHFMDNHSYMSGPKLLTNYTNGSNHWMVFFNEKFCVGPACFMTYVKMSLNSNTDATFSSVIMYLGDKPEMAQKYRGTLEVSMTCQDQEKCVVSLSGPVLHYKAAEDTDIIPYFSTPIKYFKTFMSPDDKDFALTLYYNVHVKA